MISPATSLFHVVQMLPADDEAKVQGYAWGAVMLWIAVAVVALGLGALALFG